MIILILLILFTPLAYANQDTHDFIVERPDGSVAIHYYVAGSSDTIEDTLKANDLLNLRADFIKKSELKDDADRKYWRFNSLPFGNRIAIDNAEKQADQAADQAAEAGRQATLAKMGITKKEFEDLKPFIR